MKYCKYCGAQMNDGDAVCPSCGRAAETQPTLRKVQYGNANRSQSVYDYQLRALRAVGDYYDDRRFLGGNHLLDSALLGCAYDSCIQQFDKRHETARRVGFQNLCVAVCQPDCGYIDALRQ